MRTLLFILFSIFFSTSLMAKERPVPSSKDSLLQRVLERIDRNEELRIEKVRRDSTDSIAIPHSHPKRGVAIALTVLLGPLGGHRLYLGTEPHVPVLYTVTLGGGLGLLPLIDLVQLIVKEDMDSFLNNRKFFMWIKKGRKGGDR